jgi:hypothetical protein
LHLTDPSIAIRAIVMQNILAHHELFSAAALKQHFIPKLIAELQAGWDATDDWLLRNCGLAVSCLTRHGLLMDSCVPTIQKFYDVLQRLH